MLICGAGGHARELYHFFNDIIEEVCFFDNINNVNYLEGNVVVDSFDEVQEIFKNDNRFILGVGSSKARKYLYDMMMSCGGNLKSVQCKKTAIGYNPERMKGVDVFPFSCIGPNVEVGLGTLINTRVNIHHDSKIGSFCEIAPGALVLGNVKIGDGTLIGAGAVVLPNVVIGNNVVVGAGAVVNQTIPDNSLAVGVPAILKDRSKSNTL